jgi:hypothetical protein
MQESHVRDLARKIRAVAVGHIAFSQVAEFINHIDNHLCAIAYAEEVNRNDLGARVERLEKTVAHLCPDKSGDV